MDNLSCSVIQDLMPLYHDNVCGEDSRKLVETHLEACEKCREIYSVIDDEISNRSAIASQGDQIKSYKNLKKKLRKKTIFTAVAAMACLLILLLAAITVTRIESPAIYQESEIEAIMADDEVLDIFYDHSYYKLYWDFVIVEQDGVSRVIYFIYFTDTIWTRHFPTKSGGPQSVSVGKSILADVQNNVSHHISTEKDAIYYYVADFRALHEMSNEELLQCIAEADLLYEWE